MTGTRLGPESDRRSNQYDRPGDGSNRGKGADDGGGQDFSPKETNGVLSTHKVWLRRRVEEGKLVGGRRWKREGSLGLNRSVGARSLIPTGQWLIPPPPSVGDGPALLSIVCVKERMPVV